MLALGISTAADGWQVALWDEHRAAQLHAVWRQADLWELLRETAEASPATPIVLPSGLGVPVTRAGDLLDRDIAEMSATLPAEAAERLAVLLVEARRRIPRAFCIPAVKALPSIPLHRKLGQTDLGRAETLCALTWILHGRERSGQPPASVDLLLLHLHQGLRTLLALRTGRVVDALGPTSPGSRHSGGREPGDPTDRSRLRVRDPLTWQAAEARDPGCTRRAGREALQKELLGLAEFHGLSELVVAGDAVPEIVGSLAPRLVPIPTPEPAEYAAALGAALIAAGLTGGPTAGLVDHLGIREARDRVGDWLTP